MIEDVILQADKVFRWDGPKRKQTLFSAHLGRLVLTTERLLFLSSGSNDITAKRVAGGATSPLAVFSVTGTEQLDLAALATKGSLEVDRRSIISAQLKGMFKYLTIVFRGSGGEELASTFSPKNSGMPDGPAWVHALQARG